MEPSNPKAMISIHNCATHGDYEVTTLDVLGRLIRSNVGCPKCKAETDKAAAEEAERRARLIAKHKQREHQQSLLGAAKVPERYWNNSLRDFQTETPVQKSILQKLTQYAENWQQNYENGTSLMLLGTPGTGKTHLACALIFEVTQKLNSARFTTVSDFSRAIRATYSAAAKEDEGAVLDRFADYDFLVIDEVGSSSGSDHEKQALFDLINRRYNAVMPTMLLSNLSLEEMREFLGVRTMDRLREGGGKVFVMDWESYRK